MIITLKKEAQQEKIDQLIHRFENMGLQVTVIYGENYNVFGLVGDTSKVDEKNVMANPIVANVQRVDNGAGLRAVITVDARAIGTGAIASHDSDFGGLDSHFAPERLRNFAHSGITAHGAKDAV